MRPYALLLLVTTGLALVAPNSAAAQLKQLTLEQASGRAEAPSYRGRAADVRWAPDGKHISMQVEGKKVWISPETMQQSDPLELGQPERGQLGPDQSGIALLLQKLSGVDEALAKHIAQQRRGVLRSADGEAIVLPYQGKLYTISGKPDQEKVAVIEGEGGHPIELARMNRGVGKSGTHRLAWVCNSDLYTAEIGGKVRRLTENGNANYFNGKLDWVYQEEVYGRGNFQGHWWSPDGRHLAFLALDESAVYEFTLVDHIEKNTFRVRPEVTNYPKVGDPNPSVRIGIADTVTGKIKWLDLSEYGDQEILITRVMWTPTGDACLFVVADRIQTWADMRSANPNSGKHKLMIREQAEHGWTPRPVPPRWLINGQFIWQSHRTGRRHLYLYNPDGSLDRPITSGDWQVTGIVEVDETEGRLWFTSTVHGATSRNYGRVNLDGSDLKHLTKSGSSHSLSFNADHRYFLDRSSSLAQPETVALYSGDGELKSVLATATVPAEGKYEMARWKAAEIKARDGMALDVAVLYPEDFDEHKVYPVWISTYSGPDAPTVRNSWNGNPWFQFLAQQGILVLQVNVRSASGKGLWTTRQAYRRLGVTELADLEDAVAWLCANPYADADRVGITGYSYGGFMSAYALTHSDKFALGIAGGGVYDWAMYDTIYTERYMATPALNPDGYANTSCLQHAGELKGFLHMQHGEMDDNVHLQNLMQMVYALQKADKTNWSMMIYPQTRHGIGDRDQRWHARQLEWGLIQKYLKSSATVQ
jgi:dipeptidyl-peptidase 4